MTLNRNIKIDLLKGLAIILVFFGHILQYSSTHYESFISNSFIYRIIWSVQMPLFMAISGYLLKPLCSLKDWGSKLVKNACAYLIPFISFFILKAFVFTPVSKWKISIFKDLAYGSGSSLWFLFVLFALVTIFTLAETLSNRFKHRTLFSILFLAPLLMPWVAICVLYRTDFLYAKYVLYYLIFYGAGWIVKRKYEYIEKLWNNKPLKDFFIFGLSIIYLLIISNADIVGATNCSLINTALRIVSSYISILLCIYLVDSFHECKVFKLISQIGQNTLEIYYVHLLIINLNLMLVTAHHPMSIQFLAYALVNIVSWMLITFFVIKLVRCNNVSNFLIFGKKLRNQTK